MNAHYSHVLHMDQHCAYVSDRDCFVGLASPEDLFPCPIFCFSAPQHGEERHLHVFQGTGYWITTSWQGPFHGSV
jgi:hypothetical protein